MQAANHALRHRGPDDFGSFFGAADRVGLAMRRLAILDLSPAGHQPMLIEVAGRSAVIVFNGEVYNFRELRKECEAAALRELGSPISWRGSSDTEVVLWAYLLWGEEMLALLDGMFALALWDIQKQALLIARDRYGVKPVYFSHNADRLAFASELKALLVLGGVDRTLDPVAIGQYVSFLYTPGRRTPFRDVEKLEPGEAVEVSIDGKLRRWVFANGINYGAIDTSLTVDSACERLRALLSAAVKRQMISDVPVGAFLSGGLDSSSIVTFARELAAHGKLQCFTIGRSGVSAGDDGWIEDLPYAQRVAKHLGVDLQTIWVGPEMADRFAWMVQQLDEPQGDPAALNAFFICSLAREQGIPVLLSGAGGDDIFSGYRRHHALVRETLWSWLPTRVRRGLRSMANTFPKGNPALRRASKALQYADWNSADRLISYSLWLQQDVLASLFTDDFAAAADLPALLTPMRERLAALKPSTHRLNQALALDSRFFLADHNLNYSDKMSMAASVEVRVPFLDRDLVNFSATLPPDFKQRGAEGKWILKKAMEPYLPRDVIYRSKTGFGVPLRRWLQHELRHQVEDILSESSLRQRGIFNAKGIRRLIDLNQSNKLDATYSIFAILCIEMWCRQFLDVRHP